MYQSRRTILTLRAVRRPVVAWGTIHKDGVGLCSYLGVAAGEGEWSRGKKP